MAATLIVLAGCNHESLTPPPAVPDLATGLAVSSMTAPAGDSLTVQVRIESPSGVRIGSLLGSLRFDPDRLRYLGQPFAGDAPVVVNHAEGDRGRLRMIALRLAGLDSTVAEFRFEVRRRDYLEQLRFETTEAVTPDLRVLGRPENLPLTIASARYPGTVSRPTVTEWAVYLGYATPATAAALMVPGQGTRYGDVTLGGGVNGLDVLAVLNVTVGNLNVLTDATKDLVIAGNVAPFNLPGLGEADDPIPPGRNASGTYDISGLDALALANEGVGNDQPVVGELIPGRGPAARGSY